MNNYTTKSIIIIDKDNSTAQQSRKRDTAMRKNLVPTFISIEEIEKAAFKKFDQIIESKDPNFFIFRDKVLLLGEYSFTNTRDYFCKSHDNEMPIIFEYDPNKEYNPVCGERIDYYDNINDYLYALEKES